MNKKISEIKLEFESIPIDQVDVLFEQYESDHRTGVIRLIEKYKKEQLKLQKEWIRLNKMKFFEEKYDSCHAICGIDEAGRGPLAGPVVAGAVILPKDTNILYLNDSKQLSEKMRDVLYDQIMEKAVAVGVGVVPAGVIDEINILKATYEAMRNAVKSLKVVPDLFLNDAVHIPLITTKQISIIKGDSKSISIAAASIIAKVTRDRMMREYDILFPQYKFSKNKGYGSSEHIHALKEYGPCPIHRESFIKNIL